MMWNNRNLWILMSGEFIAGLGLWLGIIGNLEFLQLKVPSDFIKSLILLTGLLAGVIVAPLAGKIIDRSKKKNVLIYSGLGRIASVLFMFLAIHFDSIWFMIAFLITIQLSAAFYFPSLQSLIPLIVKENELLQVNGIHMNVGTIARIMGTAIAGIMVAKMSLISVYTFSMTAYIFIFICTLLLKVDEEKNILPKGNTESKTDKSKGMDQETKNRQSFKEILPIIVGLPTVILALVLTLVPTFFIGGFNLMVIKISELQQDDGTIKGLLYTAEGIAFMLGAFLIKRLSVGRNLIKFLISFSFVMAFAHLSLYFADIRLLSITSFAIFGFAAGAFYPITATIFQRQIPKEYHGRFFSFRGMLDRILFQIVLLSTGLFLDTIGLQMMVLLFGCLSITLAAYYTFRQMKAPLSYINETTTS